MSDAPRIQEDLGAVDALIAGIGGGPDTLLALLQAIQRQFNYLPAAALRRVCERTGLPPAQVDGVAHFYPQFRHRPAGRHTIKVCVGTACHVKGAEAVVDAFKRHLRIGSDEDTDADRLFTVSRVACLGCCMLAPAVQVDDVTYGFVEPRRVGALLRDFLGSREAAPAAAGGAPDPAPRGEARMCLCTSCAAGGAGAVFDEFRRHVAEMRLPVAVRTVGCTGISYQTPLVEIAVGSDAVFRYGRVKPGDVAGILRRHFRPPTVARRARAAALDLLERLYTDEAWPSVTRYAVDVRDGPDAAYFGPQLRIATECAGDLDPLDFEACERTGGFSALRRALAGEWTPEGLIEEIERSGLRGRGGAGFPTGRKWRAVRAAPGETKYVIANGDEGDPGAFMDRMILESFPLRVIEGMLLAAYAVGARQGVAYIRDEYPLALRRMREAAALCERRGWLGDSVGGGGWPFRLRIVAGAGAFVCGEETALIASLEGRRGTPRFRPPYPSESGLHGRPTLVQNVETLAVVPWILRRGAAAFAAIGTPDSAGTKTFALAGKIRRGGLIEVPMGMSLRRIVEEIGGGVENGRRLKAVQVGGPSGGCVPAALADTPVDYSALQACGAIMGSGGMVVLDEDDCMVDIARYFVSFTQKESCGKCTFCRVGTQRMLEILERLCRGEARADDLAQLEHLSRQVQQGSLCGLGRTAPNPVLSTLRHFREEYEAHAAGRCPARKCAALIRYAINERCIGCTRCAQRCPADAIPLAPYERHVIDDAKCIRCDTCRQVCPADAVERVDRAAASNGAAEDGAMK